MKKIGILYDSINDNTGDKAIGIAMENFCRENDILYEVVNPFDVNVCEYSCFVIGGGLIMRNEDDWFYSNFRISGKNILNAVGVGMDDGRAEYLNNYSYITARSQADRDNLISNGVTKNIEVVPCPTILYMSGAKGYKRKFPNGSVGIHVTSTAAAACPNFCGITSDIKNKILIPFTHYNHDRGLMMRMGFGEDANILENLSPEELFSVIGKMDFVIVSSLHAAIFAYMQNVPFIAFNQSNIYRFFKDRNLDGYLFSNDIELESCIKRILRKRPDYSDLLESDKKSLKKHFEIIKKNICDNSLGNIYDCKKRSFDQIRLDELNQKNEILKDVVNQRDALYSSCLEQINEKNKEIAKGNEKIDQKNQKIKEMRESKFWKMRDLFLTFKYFVKNWPLHVKNFFKKKPLVSVVIPVYDRTFELKKSIDSILNQTYKKIEVILVTDGSPEETLRIVREYEKLKKVRVFYYEDNTGNAVRGRNRGIKEARGKYVAFQDSDDFAEKDRIKLSVRFIEKYNAQIVYGGWRAILDGTRADTGIKDGEEFSASECDFDSLLGLCVPCQSTVMVDRNALIDVGGLKNEMKYREDHELWIRLAYFGYSFKAIPHILINLRLHEGNNELNFKSEDDKWVKIMMREYKKKQDFNLIKNV